MEHIEVIDRFFYHLSHFFPHIVAVKIQGEDGLHDLPFLTEEDHSKTITFIKHVYHNNSEVEFEFSTDDTQERITITATEFDHILEFNFDYINPVFELLNPFAVEYKDEFYYSTDCGSESDNGFWVKLDEIKTVTENMRENYQFSNFCLNYYNKFDFLRLNEDLYVYNFQTFLPEDIDKVDLARLIINLIARKTRRYELLNIKKEHKLNVSLEELEEQTVLNFSFDTYPIAGYISPKKKHISVVF
jgi:hypothetical protein